MTLYADSAYPVRDDLAAAHTAELQRLSAPGTWGTGAQRLAVANEARQAGIEAGLLEAPADGGADADVDLPELVRRVVQKLAVSPKDFVQTDYEEARDGGLSDAEYVELVGVVSRANDIDVFARGIGVPLRPFAPAQPGSPSRDLPDNAVLELAWVPTVPNLPDGGAVAEALYGDKPKPYIMRSMSLVPDEYRAHVEMEQAQYMPLATVLKYDHQHHDGLTRPQVEVVAGRVSALNECFY
jgi:hypothetical protein